MLSVNNKFLRIAGAILTPSIDPVIAELDHWFEKEGDRGLLAWITSGYRTAEVQLGIVQHYAIKFKIHLEFPDILNTGVDDKSEFENGIVYKWQPAWSRLLNLKPPCVVNPPKPAHVLFDYFRPGSTENKKGELIGISPHMKGTSFDIGDYRDTLSVVKRAFDSKTIKGWKGYLVEERNNAIHCDCEEVA